MIGKKNVVFGFVFLFLTSLLGPYMVNMYADYGKAAAEKQTTVGRLQQLKQNNFEEELTRLNAEQISRANTEGLLSLNLLFNVAEGIDAIKGGPHAHGNLESLLNIVVGIALCFIAVSGIFKQIISWMFIVGTLMHAGLMYLERVFAMDWAGTVLGTGIGPILILAGLLAMGVAALMGFRGEIVRD